MATYTITTNGVTSPSSTTRAYKGYMNSVPNTFNSVSEYTTANYTSAATDDTKYVNYEYPGAVQYSVQKLEMQIPYEYQFSEFTQIDVSMIGIGSDGYAISGVKFYIYNFNSSTWELLGTNNTSLYSAVNGSKTTNISNYIDANFRIFICIAAYISPDANGGGSFTSLDYASVTITYNYIAPPSVSKKEYNQLIVI